MTSSVRLDIPPRRQWSHGRELPVSCHLSIPFRLCSSRRILRRDCCASVWWVLYIFSRHSHVLDRPGLYNGAWISQQLVRDLNHGEYLIHHVTFEDDQQRRPRGGGGGGDPLATLTTLKFSHNAWDYENAPRPQFSAYCLWIKQCLLQGFPVMFRTKLDEFFAGHIMPIVGIDYSNEHLYDERDTVHYYSLFGQGIIKQPVRELGNDPSAMPFWCYWGCIPLDVSIRFAFNLAAFSVECLNFSWKYLRRSSLYSIR